MPGCRSRRARPCLFAEVAVREGPESWIPDLGLADFPFGTTEPGSRRLPRAALSATAWGRDPGGWTAARCAGA